LLSITAFLSGLTRKKTEDRGGGHSKEAYFIQWGVVENKYREKAVKIPIERIKTYSELKRRGKTYGLSHLFEPLKRKAFD
jgi:hypothetical protein